MSDLEATLKQRVKKVLKCDVRLENPFYPHTLEPADCVITSLCLEAACKDIQTYCRALHGLTELLRPGGLLVMIGVRPGSIRPNDGSRSAGEGLCVLQSFLFTTQQEH